MRNIIFIVSALIIMGCQMKPTSAMQESVDVFDQNVVLVDTRSPLQYESFHVEGSVTVRAEDFIVIKNPRAKKRYHTREMDMNFDSIISRLAAKGIHPNKKVYLLAEKKEALSNQRMRWLLKSMEIDRIKLYAIDDFMKEHRGRYGYPKPQPVWTLKSSDLFQKEFIFEKSNRCFVNVRQWNESRCSYSWGM